MPGARPSVLVKEFCAARFIANGLLPRHGASAHRAPEAPGAGGADEWTAQKPSASLTVPCSTLFVMRKLLLREVCVGFGILMLPKKPHVIVAVVPADIARRQQVARI